MLERERQYVINVEKRKIFVQLPKDNESYLILSKTAGLKLVSTQTKKVFVADLNLLPKIEPILQQLEYVLFQGVSAQKPIESPAKFSLPPKVEAVQNPLEAPTLSISQINALIQKTIRVNFSQSLWVAGELVDYDKVAARPNSKWLFFKLIEKAEDAKIQAQLTLVIYPGDRSRIELDLATAKLGNLRDGLQIRALIQLDHFVSSGQITAKLIKIDPNYTLGAFALEKQRVWDELVRLKIAQSNLLLPDPILPLRIALFTRENSQAYIDFTKHLQESRCPCEITLFNINVQGKNLGNSFIEAFEQLVPSHFDLAVITRGGGSSADLAQFNNFEIAERIARSPLKFIVAIGHESDRCVLDEIATREKTPTAAAAYVLSLFEKQKSFISQCREKLIENVLMHLRVQESFLSFASQQIHLYTNQRREHRLRELLRYAFTLKQLSLSRISQAESQIFHAKRDLHALSLNLLQLSQKDLQFQKLQLRNLALSQIDTHGQDLRLARGIIDTANPKRLLQLGFSILYTSEGKLLRSTSQMHSGDKIRAVLFDGDAQLRVEETQDN